MSGRAPAVVAGDAAPEFELQRLDGGTLRSGELRGRATLIVFLRHLY